MISGVMVAEDTEDGDVEADEDDDVIMAAASTGGGPYREQKPSHTACISSSIPGRWLGCLFNMTATTFTSCAEKMGGRARGD